MALSTRRPASKKTPKAFSRALALFKAASKRVPAYKDFLRKAKIRPDSIETPDDFKRIPTIDKVNYISAYPLEALSWDGELSAKYISSSSGSTGIPFYWPRGTKQDIAAGRFYQGIYERIFGTKNDSTLGVDLFSLGTWIAGLEFYNASKWTADRGNEIVMLTPGIEKVIARDAIKRLAPAFKRIVIAGYPPFIKDVLEAGASDGLDWTKWDVRLLGAGESFSELWRDKVLRLVDQSGSLEHFINVYGMAEAGVVAHETPLTICARKHAADIAELSSMLVRDGQISPLYQYDDTMRFFEADKDDSIVLTYEGGLPLVRYNTRDRGGVISNVSLMEMLGTHANELKRHSSQKFNMSCIYLYGRKDLSISLYALNIYVENIKEALETAQLSSHLSGLFIMQIGHDKTLDQRFEITVELSENHSPSGALEASLKHHVIETLCRVNSEYAKLRASIGDKTDPTIILVRNGEIQTVPGRKHKWVKRS